MKKIEAFMEVLVELSLPILVFSIAIGIFLYKNKDAKEIEKPKTDTVKVGVPKNE